MSPNELRDSLTTKPFEPFRLVMSDGATYDIRYPDLLWVGQRSAFDGLTASMSSTLFERSIKVDLLHVTQIVPLGSGPAQANGYAST